VPGVGSRVAPIANIQGTKRTNEMTATKRRPLLLALAAVVLVGIAAFVFRPHPQPEYCWLVFGPQAKARLLVCLTGEKVTFDEYADEEPTGRTESFADRLECKDFAIADPDGSTSYVITGMSGAIARAGIPTELFVNVRIQGPLEYRQYCDAVMSDDPSTAPVVHFHGPLRVAAETINGELSPGLGLRRGTKATDLRACVGTIDAKRGCWVVVASQDDKRQPLFPTGVHPCVDVEFPAKDQNTAPIRNRYPLDGFC
jgi:hypothetical protein